MTNEQIEQKKQLLEEKVKQMKAIYNELVEAGAIALGSPLATKPMEQREQSDACIESAESRQRKTKSQGTQELSEEELDGVAGGGWFFDTMDKVAIWLAKTFGTY